MWSRKKCGVCRTDFGVHPKANTFNTRQLCVVCRKLDFTLKYSIVSKYAGSKDYNV
jgi:hypothetical protein